MTIPKVQGIDVHPAANIFPMMDAVSFQQLVDDIRVNGQRESCSTWKGQLIDGRNRWAACQVLGIEPEVGEYEDDNLDVVAFVLSANLHRRHLTESQRGLVAVRVAELFKPAAKERQKATLRKGTQMPVTQNLGERNNQDKHAGEATSQAAQALNVSRGTGENAKTVLKEGSKELIAAVERGDVSVSKAAKVAKAHDKKSQMAALNDQPIKKKQPERDVFIQLRKLFDAMTRDEQEQAALLWDSWLVDKD